MYFSDAPVQPSNIDQTQYAALQAFKKECQTLGLYFTYDDLSSFRRDFKQHLDIELNSPRFQLMSRRPPNPVSAVSELSADAMILLTKSVEEKSPISITNRIGIDAVHVAGETITDGSERSLARWRAAIRQLLDFGLVEERKAGSGLFQAIEAGYQAVEKAEGSKPVSVSIRMGGTPDKQELQIRSGKPLKLSKVEYMHSTEACIADQSFDLSGTEIHALLDHKSWLI